MTNEEREALIALGWTPPVPFDPDLIEAREIAKHVNRDAGNLIFADLAFQGQKDNSEDVLCALAGIKRGRALATEAKPSVVWVKHDRSRECPVEGADHVWVKDAFETKSVQTTRDVWWPNVTHYAVITPPEEK